MRLQSREELVAKLYNKKYREAFISSRISNTLALQIRAMRQERGWSQAHLAKLLGTSQNAVYRLESPQYGKYSITTLRRLASIFDVGLAVWLVPFSKLVDRVTHLSTDDILVPSFDADPGLQETVAALNPRQIDNRENVRLVVPVQVTNEKSPAQSELDTTSCLFTQILQGFLGNLADIPYHTSGNNLNKPIFQGKRLWKVLLMPPEELSDSEQPVLQTPERKLESRQSETFVSLYSNHVAVRTTPWDLQLTFGEIKSVEEQRLEVEYQLAVNLSPQTAKSLLNVLSSQIDAYERQFGEIPYTPVQPAVDEPTA